LEEDNERHAPPCEGYNFGLIYGMSALVYPTVGCGICKKAEEYIEVILHVIRKCMPTWKHRANKQKKQGS